MPERLRAPEDPDILTVRDVMAELGIGERTVLRLIREGYLKTLPGLKKRHLITRVSVERLKAGEAS